MATAPTVNVSERSIAPPRRLSNWVGCVFFSGLGLWVIATGWLPVARQSALAAVLMLPNWMSFFVMAFGFLHRKPLAAGCKRLLPRIVSYIGSFAVPVYFTLVRGSLPVRQAGAAYIIAILLFLASDAYNVWIVWVLRHGMSIEPQARLLITSGPYRYARHPLYAAYTVRHAAIALMYLDIRLTVVIVLWWALQLYRIRCEEDVLTDCFPEYREFKEQVWMFSPRLF